MKILFFFALMNASIYLSFSQSEDISIRRNDKNKNASTSFSQCRKTVLHQIRTELNESISLLKDTTNLPDSIFHLAYLGDFSLSGFGLTVAELESASGTTKDSERNTKCIVQLLNLEAKKANTFSQLNVLKTIRLDGIKLDKNRYWNILDSNQRKAWIEAADVRRMYDPLTKTILNGRPTNYLGVAAQVATLSFELGFEKDEKMVNDLLNHCVAILEKNNGWLNDGKGGEFRFDRYHFEYIRFVWESAIRMNRKDLLRKLEPWCESSDQIWTSLEHPISGSSFAYGRSLQNTWDDVWEYGDFMLKRKKRSTSEKKEILSRIFKTWKYYYENEYDNTRHVARMLDSGRACYGYVGASRIWGYSVHSLGKMLATLNGIRDQKLEKSDFPTYLPSRESISNFHLKENYRIWSIRTKTTRIIVPLVTGIGKPTNSDYQPILFAEGISEPPVGLATTHLLPGIYRNGNLYLPKMEFMPIRTKRIDSIVLRSSVWISKVDTLPAISSPNLLSVYQYQSKNNTFVLKYVLDNLDQTNSDSLLYSIWKSKWTGSPYEIAGRSPKWEIKAPDFEETHLVNDITKPEGRGAFTALPETVRLKLKSIKQPNVSWQIGLELP